MSDSGFLAGGLLVGLLAVAVLTAMLAFGLTRPGPRRAGLVAGALPLALLVPVLAAVYGAFRMIRAFSAVSGAQGSAQHVMDASASVWLLIRVSWGGVAVLCLVGLLVGLARFGGGRADPRCSMRRGLVVALLPLLGLLTAGTHVRQLGRGLRVAAAVTSAHESDPQSVRATEAVLAAEGLPRTGGIARISRFIARSMLIGSAGGLAVVPVLLGLATTGFILTWRVRFDGGLRLATSAVWALAGLGAGLVALGFFDPLKLT